MKIAFVSFDQGTFRTAFSPIAKALRSDGHEVRSFYKGVPYEDIPHSDCDPRWFDTSPVDNWKPDRVLIWNGRLWWGAGWTTFLKKNHRCYYAEQGWLPQQDFIYISKTGVGADAYPLEHEIPWDYDKIWHMIRKNYDCVPFPTTHKNYVLVPLQLEYDTTVVYDSHMFKKMRELVQFVRLCYPNDHLIIKPHPLDTSGGFYDYGVENCTLAPKEVPVRQFYENARLVVGINSTALIEAMVYLKPVIFLGSGVLGPVENIPSMHDPVDTSNYKLTIACLYNYQINKQKPDMIRVKKYLEI